MKLKSFTTNSLLLCWRMWWIWCTLVQFVFGKSGMGLELLLHMNGCIRKGAHLVAFHLVISVEKRIVRRSTCLREEHDTPWELCCCLYTNMLPQYQGQIKANVASTIMHNVMNLFFFLFIFFWVSQTLNANRMSVIHRSRTRVDNKSTMKIYLSIYLSIYLFQIQAWYQFLFLG